MYKNNNLFKISIIINVIINYYLLFISGFKSDTTNPYSDLTQLIPTCDIALIKNNFEQR